MTQRTRIADIEEHKVKTGETLASLAGTVGMTENQLAEFNWKTSVPEQVNQHLRDDVGCTQRNAAGNYVFDDSDDPGIVLLPKEFTRSGLAVDQVHKIVVKTIEPKRNMLECVCVPGGTFEFDKSFIRPTIASHIKKLEEALEKFPDAKIIIFAHTDRVGDELYNKKLSERRAESTYAFVTDRPDIWERLYNQESWGTRVIQIILEDLGHDPGPIDGIQGAQTTAAIKEFQGANGLAVDGVAGPNTRKKLFLDYMTGNRDVKVADAQFAPPKFMGCGEFNPLVEPNENELANRSPGNEPNRRIVFYLFKNPPTIPCKIANLAPCKQEIAKPGERENPLHKCAFYDRLSMKCKCDQEDPQRRRFTWEIRLEYDAFDDAVEVVRLEGEDVDYREELPRSAAQDQGAFLSFLFPEGEGGAYRVVIRTQGKEYNVWRGLLLPDADKPPPPVAAGADTYAGLGGRANPVIRYTELCGDEA